MEDIGRGLGRGLGRGSDLNQLERANREKAFEFCRTQKRTHIVKIRNHRYPKGQFFNGYITQIFENRLLFLDDVEVDPVEIFFSEIEDISEWRKKE